MHRLQVEMSEGRYGTLPSTILLGLDANGDVQQALGQQFPVVILADSFNRVFFLSEGYTIGLGEQLAATVAKL